MACIAVNPLVIGVEKLQKASDLSFQREFYILTSYIAQRHGQTGDPLILAEKILRQKGRQKDSKDSWSCFMAQNSTGWKWKYNPWQVWYYSTLKAQCSKFLCLRRQSLGRAIFLVSSDMVNAFAEYSVIIPNEHSL